MVGSDKFSTILDVLFLLVFLSCAKLHQVHAFHSKDFHHCYICFIVVCVYRGGGGGGGLRTSIGIQKEAISNDFICLAIRAFEKTSVRP